MALLFKRVAYFLGEPAKKSVLSNKTLIEICGEAKLKSGKIQPE